jgi:PAS domain S-box-containing protein
MDLNDERLAELRLQLDETDRQRAEVVAYSKNGTPIWVELTNIALRGESRVTGYVGIHRNITGRKRLEAEQQQLVIMSRSRLTSSASVTSTGRSSS